MSVNFNETFCLNLRFIKEKNHEEKASIKYTTHSCRLALSPPQSTSVIKVFNKFKHSRT